MYAMTSGLFIGNNDGRLPNPYKENLVSLNPYIMSFHAATNQALISVIMVMIRFHNLPADPATFLQVFVCLSKFSHRLSLYPWSVMVRRKGCSKAQCSLTHGLARIIVRSLQARQVRFQSSGFSQSDQGTHCFRSLRGVVVKLLAL